VTRTEEINGYMDRMYANAIRNGMKKRCFNKYGHSHRDFDEAFQNAVIKVYNQLLKNSKLRFDSDGHIASYLFKSITSIIVDVNRTPHRKRTVHFEALSEESEASDWMAELGVEDTATANNDEEDEASYQRLRIEKALAQLRLDHAETIRLNAQGLTYEEAGASMSITSAQYKVMLYHARQKMKKLLGGRW
jgi:RNA polymerase sigma factor (sigma-70 family)